jgi:predicted nucleic acid-binding protein
MNVVVTDTGPLLHLHQIGVMDLIARLGDIHVTPQVWAELQRHAPSLKESGLPEWLTWIIPSATAADQAAQWQQARLLDAGEAEALAYARDISADLFLTDDTAARTLGESLGIQVRGSLGVVLYLAASGHLSSDEASQVLDALEQRSTLWMSAKVRAFARVALRAIFERA